MYHGRIGDHRVTEGAEIGFPSGDTGHSVIHIIPPCNMWNQRLQEMVQTGQAGRQWVSPIESFCMKLHGVQICVCSIAVLKYFHFSLHETFSVRVSV
jgi:hypothetical protein